MPRSEERGGMAARSVAEEQKSYWFKKPRLEGRGSLLEYIEDFLGPSTTQMIADRSPQ